MSTQRYQFLDAYSEMSIGQWAWSKTRTSNTKCFIRINNCSISVRRPAGVVGGQTTLGRPLVERRWPLLRWTPPFAIQGYSLGCHCLNENASSRKVREREGTKNSAKMVWPLWSGLMGVTRGDMGDQSECHIFIGPRYTWGPIYGSGCL